MLLLLLQIAVTGGDDPRLAPFDELMRSFLEEHQAPGAALAVARNGRLVYSRGFGTADRATGEPVAPDALFRIASISKPVTAAAVVRLARAGKFGLDDRLVELLDVAPTLEGDAKPDPRWEKITVRRLLQHTAGFDRGVSKDPMFMSERIARAVGTEPPAGTDAIHRWMRGRPLDFEPGERTAYSNFGYLLLGRLIETKTGQAYEAHVRKELLEPMGITRMRLGATRRSGRAEGEVVYHTRRPVEVDSVVAPKDGKVAPPYGAWSLEAMDAHGGWIASAPDLVRFACALTPEDRATMLAPPPGKPTEPYYGCGWLVRPVGADFTFWHTGALDGTSTLLVSRHDGLAWAVLFNMRQGKGGKDLVAHVDAPLHQAADQVKEWP